MVGNRGARDGGIVTQSRLQDKSLPVIEASGQVITVVRVPRTPARPQGTARGKHVQHVIANRQMISKMQMLSDRTEQLSCTDLRCGV